MGIIKLKPPILANGGSLNPNVIEGLIFLLKFQCINGKEKCGKETMINKYWRTEKSKKAENNYNINAIGQLSDQNFGVLEFAAVKADTHMHITKFWNK